MVIGDSFTFGEGVKEEDSFPRLIEKDLNIETFNPAMQGMNTRLERITYEHLDWLQPNPVMLVYTTNYTMPVMETINAGARWKESIKIPPWIMLSNTATFFYQRIKAFRKTQTEIKRLQEAFIKGWNETAEEILTIRKLSEGQGARFLLVLFLFLFELDGPDPIHFSTSIR